MAQKPSKGPLSGLESSIYSAAYLGDSDQPAVLIIDEFAYTRELLAYTLSQAGYQTHTASCARGVLECVAQYAIDAIVLDVQVSGRLGAEFLQNLRSQDTTRETPVVVLARSNKKSHVLRVMQHGISGYLIKSQFSVEKLLDSLSNAIASRP